MDSKESKESELITLSTSQINEFITNGVVVIPNVLDKQSIDHSVNSLHKSLIKYGIVCFNIYNFITFIFTLNDALSKKDSNNLKETAINLNKLSTTGGAGGIIDLFYEPWRLDLATNPKIFNIVTQLWSNTYGKYKNNINNDDNKLITMIDQIIQFINNNNNNNNNCLENMNEINQDLINLLYNHPFDEFDTNTGYIYMNRVCYRVSDDIANYHAKGAKKKRKLQRCLAPHLDCCPHDLFGQNRDKLGVENMKRWRPIQLFIALTDNHTKNTGGFECVKGFHRKFAEYFKNKTNVSRLKQDMKDTICVGDFCRLLPNEDRDILNKYQHIEYDAGSLILFDWRIPHANARYNKCINTRIVVYTGLLPNIELNKEYCRQQLNNYYNKKAPPDFWGRDNYSNQKNKANQTQTQSDNVLQIQVDQNYKFSKLGQRLMGIASW